MPLRRSQPGDYTTVIFDRGCLRSGEEWVERNLVPVAGVAVAMAVLQVSLSLSLPSTPKQMSTTYSRRMPTCLVDHPLHALHHFFIVPFRLLFL